MEEKKRALSLIQPSGAPTLGNYLGALKNWKTMQDAFDCVFGVADLHAITVRKDPAALRAQTIGMAALYLSVGLDPKKSTLFIQSQVPQHAQLAWILGCFTQFGELARMTQFKDKSARHADNVNAGLFTYPVLMAADILLYRPDAVPVGDDQRQHLEIARDIATRFNGLYGDVFKVPEPYILPVGARVMSLQDPLKKMSKSDENENGRIGILDSPDEILRKFKRAVTDSQGVVSVGDGRHGINNLIGIYGAVTGKTADEVAREFEGKGYGVFKQAVAEAVIEELRPIREQFAHYMDDRAELERVYRAGAEKASAIAERTLNEVMRRVGFAL